MVIIKGKSGIIIYYRCFHVEIGVLYDFCVQYIFFLFKVAKV